MSAPPVRVRVYDLAAKGLRSADSNGLSDPYAELTCGRERFKTEVVNESLDPVWAKTNVFTFGTKEDLETLKGINVTLFDKDFLGKDLLGTVFLSFDELWGAPPGQAIASWRAVNYNGLPAGRYGSTCFTFISV